MIMDVPDVVPLFPLPDHVLLIGVPMPFRIFEPRYRSMIDDVLGQNPEQRYIAVPRLAEGWETDYHGAPAFVAHAALAKVLNIRPLADAQFLVVVEGVVRCHLVECPSTFPYRLARPQIMVDEPDEPDVVGQALTALLAQVERLSASLGHRGEALRKLVADVSDQAAVIDRLGSAVLGDLGDRQTFLESRRVGERIGILRQALAAALSRLTRRGKWEPSEN